MDRHVEVRVTGVVQGVGYRPFVHARAHELGLLGHVGNDSAGVFVDAQGDPEAVEQLLAWLRKGPPLAVVEDVIVRDLPLGRATEFVVAASTEAVGTTSIPPDTAVCEECLAECRDPQDRRYGYPFIACTNCGPRYTIVERLPYDRPGTTMADFPLCAECDAEYHDPASRRFHAQPACCPACGPRLTLGPDAIAAALGSGAIVALKGIGGYHLVCDARDRDAVARLRERKGRGDKPFALMVASVADAAGIVELSEEASVLLSSPQRPIVLAPSLDAGLQESAAPGNGYLGVMLPYAPVHHLLFAAGAPAALVMTSGNVSDEPICTTEQEAIDRLGHIADLLVHHDRRIHISCDDSVVRIMPSGVQPVRRSRGYAPLPITLPVDAPAMLAVGGELKTTLAVAQGRHAWLSQHIGDTANLETLGLLQRTAETLASLQRVSPEWIVSDRHPGYLSRRWAIDESARLGAVHLEVQHHHAHLASLLAEHGWPADEPVIGMTFDGTGFGTDGTIWGGEILLGTYAGVTRVGHLRPVSLPGGDAAVRRPLRTALAHLHAAGLAVPPELAQAAEPFEVDNVRRMMESGAGCTPTTSMGRLFDAMAALLGIRQQVDYEGQAAIELEAIAATWQGEAAGWTMDVLDTPESIVIDPSPALRAGIQAALEGQQARAAFTFHHALAEAVRASARILRDRTGVGVVGLTGGVFANSVLTGLCQGTLGQDGFTVLTHRLVPPNDGGLALGQVAVAAAGGALKGSA